MTSLDRSFADYMAGDFWDDVIRTSAERLANPLPFALEALEDLFRYESDKEAGFARFQRKMESFIWWADDAVQCLEKVLLDPPDNLGDLVRHEADVVIWVQTPAGETTGDAAAHEAWLRVTVARMRAMFDRYVADKTAELQARQPDE